MTQRTGFVLHVRPDKIDEYVAAHQNVWPEMLDALRSAGIHNYTIFRAGNSVPYRRDLLRRGGGPVVLEPSDVGLHRYWASSSPVAARRSAAPPIE